MDEPIIGINLGISNSYIGVFKNFHVEIIPNSFEENYTPSIVDILDEGECVGEETILHYIDENNSTNRISQIKRIIGRKFSTLHFQEIERYNLIEDPKNKDKILIKVKRNENEEFISPECVMVLIIKKLIINASNFIGTKVKRAVLTVPQYFDYNQRNALIESAKLAGIEILQLINEPNAAALAYMLDSSISTMNQDNKNNRNIMVIDLGGGTIDISILNTKDNLEFSLITSCGDLFLGGDDFDYKLVDYCINKFYSSNSQVEEEEIRRDKNILRRLKIHCEKAKKNLSKSNKTYITIYNFFKSYNLYAEITRKDFDSICDDLYKRIKAILDKVIIDSKLTLDEIDDLIVVGGSSRIPKIKEILKEKFGEEKIKDNLIEDEAITIGACLQAYQIIKSNTDIDIMNKASFSLEVDTKIKNLNNKEKGTIVRFSIEKNKDISHISEIKTYKTIEDNQKYFKIQILTCQNKTCNNNILLKEFKIENIPEGKAGTVYLKIHFEIKKDGILFINVEEKSNGQKIIEHYSLIERTTYEIKDILIKKPKIKGKINSFEIIEITDIIKEKEDLMKSSNKNEEKFRFLKELSEICSKLIKFYSSLLEQSDSFNLHRKLIENYERMLKYYFDMIIILEDEKRIDDLINEIKEIFSKITYDDYENMVNNLKQLKEKKPEKYALVVLFCVEILCREGQKILNEGKKYYIYYARKLFAKAEIIFSYFDQNLKEYMNFNLSKLYKELEQKCQNKLGQINYFVHSLKSKINLKETNLDFIEEMVKKATEPENLYIVLDILSEIADYFSQNKRDYNELEALCLFNIIKIKFDFLLDQDLNNLKIYSYLMNRIDFLIDRLDLDEEINWIVQYENLKEDINKKYYKEMHIEISKKNTKLLEELNDFYRIKIKEEKNPMAFLEFIFKKYPFLNYDNIKEQLKNKNWEQILEIVHPKYHPNNFSNRELDAVYNEIFILLWKMKEDFIKYK